MAADREFSRREMIGGGGIAVLLIERVMEYLRSAKKEEAHQRLLDAWQVLLDRCHESLNHEREH